jgi:hypothetical protein
MLGHDGRTNRSLHVLSQHGKSTRARAGKAERCYHHVRTMGNDKGRVTYQNLEFQQSLRALYWTGPHPLCRGRPIVDLDRRRLCSSQPPRRFATPYPSTFPLLATFPSPSAILAFVPSHSASPSRLRSLDLADRQLHLHRPCPCPSSTWPLLKGSSLRVQRHDPWQKWRRHHFRMMTAVQRVYEQSRVT